MTLRRHRLTTRQRETLYDRECVKATEAGRGEYPICNLCDVAVLPGHEWDESHDPAKPHAWGGTQVGVAHRRCNRLHGAKVVTPMVAKAKRQFRRDRDITRSATPLPGGREDWANRKKKMDGTVVDRATGQPWRPQ